MYVYKALQVGEWGSLWEWSPLAVAATEVNADTQLVSELGAMGKSLTDWVSTIVRSAVSPRTERGDMGRQIKKGKTGFFHPRR